MRCLLVLAVAAFVSCYRPPLQSADIRVPELLNPDCAGLLAERLRSTYGVKKAQAFADTSLVAVTFDPQVIALRNIEHKIAALGFDVHSTLNGEFYLIAATTEAKAARPEPCRPPPAATD